LHYDRISTDRCEVQLQGIDGTFNYAYIVELDRYYFVDSSRIDQTGVTRLYLTLDPLMTYRDLILSATATATRSEQYNGLTTDTAVSKQDKAVSELTFADKLDHTGNIVLVTIKG